MPTAGVVAEGRGKQGVGVVRRDMELPASPPSVAPSPPDSPDRGGAVFLRKELNSTRHQVRQLLGSVDSLNAQLVEAQDVIASLRAENAALRRLGTADLSTRSAPARAAAQAGAWGIQIDLRAGRMDPVAVLGPELSAMFFLLVRADRVASLHQWRRVSRTWNSALTDDALWRPLCESTWSSWRWPQLSTEAFTGCQRERGLWRQWFTNAHWSASELGITAEELVGTTWQFEFKDDQSGLKEASAQFFADGTFVSTVPSAPSGRRPLPYQLCNEPLQGSGIGTAVGKQHARSFADAAGSTSPAYKFVQGVRQFLRRRSCQSSLLDAGFHHSLTLTACCGGCLFHS